MSAFMKFADLLLALAKLLTILIVAGMVFSVLVGVFFRFVIPIPMAWPPEAARFLMVAVTMIGSSIAVRQLDHVGITLLVDRLPRGLALALYIVGSALIMVFLVVFIWFSARLTLEMGPRQISSSLGLNMIVAYAAMPIGGFMMLVQQVAALVEAIQRSRAGASPFALETSAATSV
ncbi:TRAP transporter small permease [Devosia sediminis]|uniref:TRAP transporter small permease protein n=1 Tax=Devosia sediminis TaxID=2798801 RepID=A0A934ML51_9HYPH|nr:TRAP transporter small permease [Devosia sediminis]MBJ3785853.1 TRAP transporter small permease [Devosia sediminis]